MQINLMNMSDLQEIKDTLSTSFDSFWSFDTFKSEIENLNSIYFTVKEDSEIIAFAGIWKAIDEIHLMNIVTRKDKRNLGIATYLLNYIIEYCKTTSFPALTLEVSELNSDAIKLYEKFNFKKVGLRKNYYKQNENAIIMTLSL